MDCPFKIVEIDPVTFCEAKLDLKNRFFNASQNGKKGQKKESKKSFEEYLREAGVFQNING